MEQLEYRDLVAGDAQIIGEAERLIYGADNPSLINGLVDIKYELQVVPRENFSIGAFDPVTGRLVGYVISYSESSAMAEDKIAYVSDFAVTKEYRIKKFRSLEHSIVARLFSLVSVKTRASRLPLEADFREASYRLLKSRQGFVEGLGYRISDERLLPKYRGGEDFYRIRLELIDR